MIDCPLTPVLDIDATRDATTKKVRAKDGISVICHSSLRTGDPRAARNRARTEEMSNLLFHLASAGGSGKRETNKQVELDDFTTGETQM